MTAEGYNRITKWFRVSPKRVMGLKLANCLITGATYLAYVLMLLWLFVHQDGRFFRIVVTTGISFIALSFFRTYLSYPRPYEALDIQPLIPKNKQGKSFPSRHVFSIFVIAVSLYYLQPVVGTVFLAEGVVLAGIRVIAGFHFPKDVVVGAVCGILAGILGLYVV